MLKYVVVENMYPIIFDPSLTHKDIASNLNVTSAGFIENGKCYGYSDSLNLGISEKDEYIIRIHLKYLEQNCLSENRKAP